ncbi:MAG: glucan biosynthesis protein [Alphaproteobacteria bacterium]|nr:MAG: glucan biosynthesis protein [Alphaproteobacteria bacterium]
MAMQKRIRIGVGALVAWMGLASLAMAQTPPPVSAPAPKTPAIKAAPPAEGDQARPRKGAAAAATVASVPRRKTEGGVPFSYDQLIDKAKLLARKPFAPPSEALPEWLANLDYDGYRDLRYRPEKSLWHEEDLPYQMQFFHRGGLYRQKIIVHEVVGGLARPVPYLSELFDYGRLSPPSAAPEDLGYAGLRVHGRFLRPDRLDEVLVFLGASYFRSLGRGQHYGKSARGLAIDTALAKGEEFPVFREFWVQRPEPGDRRFTVYALLDSASVAGAYRFEVTPGETTVMDVLARLYTRKPIERLGIAPLTSMYQFGENQRVGVDDFRPEVHDSDGLELATGAGEWLWRPLNNPPELRVSSFQDENPRGFGLMQRDRDFNNYQDLEAHYDKRPSLWVEPQGAWGKGSVQLVEIPTDSEIHDNIVAYWVPEKPISAKAEYNLAYRLYWGNDVPAPPNLARVEATRIGKGDSPRNMRFILDFAGGALDNLSAGETPSLSVWSSGGQVSPVVVQRNPGLSPQGGWRAFFFFTPPGREVTELRATLQMGNQPISETWSYQWSR